MLGICCHASFFLGHHFGHENGGDMFLRNVDLLPTDYHKICLYIIITVNISLPGDISVGYEAVKFHRRL
jgi:hypothetical protein